MLRAVAEGGPTRRAMEAMLLRHCNQSAWEGAHSGTPLSIVPAAKSNWWASALIQWGHDLREPLQLYFPALDYLRQVPAFCTTPTPLERHLIQELQLQSWDELINWGVAPPRPISFLKKLPLRFFPEPDLCKHTTFIESRFSSALALTHRPANCHYDSPIPMALMILSHSWAGFSLRSGRY